MRVIGIETSSKSGSVALCVDRTVVAGCAFETGMVHGKELMPAIKSIFDEHSLMPADIDLIAISVGPGSYTGLRAGIACAKILSYALKKPVIDVPSLDVIAQNVKDKHKYICPVLDAKRGQVYACIYKYSANPCVPFHPYRKDDSLLKQQTSECLDLLGLGLWEKMSGLLIISPQELANTLPEGTCVFGEGVTSYMSIFKKKGLLIKNGDISIPKADVVAILGEFAYEGGRRCDMNTLQPIYLRKPEAIERLETGGKGLPL